MIPDIVDAVLRLVLPVGEHGDSILGDLRQELDLHSEEARPGSHLRYLASGLSVFFYYAPRAVSAHFFGRRHRRAVKESRMGNLIADLRFGLRVLLRTPQLSAIAVLTIALGVGITTHTFSVVYGTILRGLPVPNDHELVDVNGNILTRNVVGNSLSFPDYQAVQEQVTAFSAVAGAAQGTVNLAGEDAPPERYAGAFVTSTLFGLIGVEPLLGRTFVPSDDQPGASLAIVLSHRVWQNRFGGDTGVLGMTIRANAELATIVGVMPKGFRFPFDEDLWLPGRYDTAEPRETAASVGVVARLREGSTIESAAAQLSALDRRIAAEYPNTNEGLTFAVQSYEESVMPAEIQATLWAMLAAVFGVLLISCVNVANLLLARATLRTKEMAVRTAMGASRWRVTRQLLAESGILAFFGSVLGLGFAYFGVAAFNRAILDIQKPYWIDIRVDVTTLVFTLTITALVAIVAGIVPARRAAGVHLGEVLKDESRGSSSSSLGKFSSSLVMAELAVSCALLVGAGLMVKSVVNLRAQDLGFEPAPVMTGRVGLFEGDYPTREDRADFFRRLEAEVSAIPGVTAASLVSDLPATGSSRWSFGIEGESYLADADYPQTWGSLITSRYFDVMNVERLQGRAFEVSDNDPDADPVMIVNESFVRRYFPDGDAIGRSVRLGRADSTNPWMRIVGIVRDVYVGGGVGGIGNDQLSADQVYIPIGAFDLRFLSIAVAGPGLPSQMATPIREAVARLDPNLPVYEVSTMDRVIALNTWAFGLFGSLFALFGVVALFLAAVGLYGVMAFSVSQRRQELGVRMALGAESRDVVKLVMRRGTLQLAVGLFAGLGLGWLLARPLAVILYGVNPSDPMVYGAITVTLLVAGLLASFIPARAATRADPVSAMRT
jgi:putative ABC transport system permease protein